jgi:hypothetical protein
MSILISKVLNLTTKTFTIPLPGIDPHDPLVIGPSATVDLRQFMTLETLEALQPLLNEMISSGSLSSVATVSSTSLESPRSQPQIVLPSAPPAQVGYTQADIQTMVNLLNALQATVNAMNS